jgi:hypothetical protein
MADEPIYLFECPLTKRRVVADTADAVEGCRLRWLVACAACGQRHLVNVATGRVRVTVAPTADGRPGHTDCTAR